MENKVHEEIKIIMHEGKLGRFDNNVSKLCFDAGVCDTRFWPVGWDLYGETPTKPNQGPKSLTAYVYNSVYSAGVLIFHEI